MWYLIILFSLLALRSEVSFWKIMTLSAYTWQLSLQSISLTLTQAGWVSFCYVCQRTYVPLTSILFSIKVWICFFHVVQSYQISCTDWQCSPRSQEWMSRQYNQRHSYNGATYWGPRVGTFYSYFHIYRSEFCYTYVILQELGVSIDQWCRKNVDI